MYDFFGPIVDFMTFSPEYSHNGTKKELRPDFTCQYPFQRITITWDGTIPLCIADKKSQYVLGNLERDSIRDAWHGKMMKRARELHIAHRASTITCCVTCDRAVTKQVGNIRLSNQYSKKMAAN